MAESRRGRASGATRPERRPGFVRVPRWLPLILVASLSLPALAATPPLQLIDVQATATESLDWLAADADLIVRGRVITVVVRPDPVTKRDDWEEATIDVQEILKGPKPDGDVKVLRSTRHIPHGRWHDRPALYFLVAGRRAAWLKSPDLLQGRYLLVDPGVRAIPLERDARRGPLAVTADGRALHDPEDVLSATRDAVARQSGAPARLRPALAELPDDVDRQLGTLLTVPADDRWLADARRRLDAGRPIRWLDELKDPYFRNPVTEALVYEALTHPSTTAIRYSLSRWPRPLDRFELRVHGNRGRAVEVLHGWGVPPAPVDVETPLLRRVPVRVRPPVALAALLLLAIPYLLARRGAFGVRSFLAYVSLLLAAASIAGYHRSHAAYDSLVWQTPSTEHEFSSCYGDLRYLLLTGGPPSGAAAAAEYRPPSHAATALHPLEHVPHHTNYLTPDHRMARWGMSFDTGLTPPAPGHPWPPTPATAWHFHFLTVPWRWLTAGLLTYPTLHLLAALFRAARARRRAKRHQCPACGYDLRHHRSARCPECGCRVAGVQSSLPHVSAP